LIVANVLVFVAQTFLGESFTNGFSLVPMEITTFQDLKGVRYHKAKVEVPGFYDHKGHYHPRFEEKQFPIKHYTGPFPIFLTLFTSMFMHADVVHLIGNMWFLLIFGRNVECAMNHGRFLAFYTACGVCASFAHIASDPRSIIPCLGASGAISGILGAYISIHPLNKIKIWFGWLIGVIDVPAIIVIGFWFVLQYISAFMSLEHEGVGGVAYWNHLGGFCAGFVILRGMVFYLRQQQANGELTEEEPLAPYARPEDTLSDALPPPIPEETPGQSASSAEQTAGVKAGEPDPFESFLSIRTLRQMQEQSKQEQT
jgi:membrane associated rhomboid family serine protease